MFAFIAPTINAATMTKEEIAAAWSPVLNELYDLVLDSGFDTDVVELYEYAQKMYCEDYALATDYVKQVATDELPF